MPPFWGKWPKMAKLGENRGGMLMSAPKHSYRPNSGHLGVCSRDMFKNDGNKPPLWGKIVKMEEIGGRVTIHNPKYDDRRNLVPLGECSREISTFVKNNGNKPPLWGKCGNYGKNHGGC